MRDNPIETIKQDGFTGKIWQDEGGFDTPRDWDNLGKMLCWTKHYSLGDIKLLENYSYSKECKLQNLTNECNGWNEVEEVLKKEFGAVVILPLFLYDHSGLSMKTHPHGQHAGWDGGYVGFIYATKEDILKAWDKKKLTKSLLDKAEQCLMGEVETYNQYLQGDVYCFHIEDKDGETIDSCGGYYGLDECIKEVKSQIEYYKKDREKSLQETKELVFG
jgi:hypothetical protein